MDLGKIFTQTLFSPVLRSSCNILWKNVKFWDSVGQVLLLMEKD